MTNSKLILGTVQMGLSYGVNNHDGKVSRNDAFEILKKAFDSGIRILDTAESYGEAHQLIGDFHKHNPKSKFKVITKVPSKEQIIHVEQKVEKYLNVLELDQLEGFMFHSYESYRKNSKVVQNLVNLKKMGLIKQIGVSIYRNNKLKELLSVDNIDLIQIPFNLLDNFSIRGKVLEQAKIRGKTIHTRSAFLQGLFFKDPYDQHPVVQALQSQMLEIQRISQETGIHISTMALAYCMSQPFVDQVLIGVDSVSQLKLNFEASNYQLPKNTIQLIDQMSVKNIKLLNPALWEELKD
jgi:uncharacterized protein